MTNDRPMITVSAGTSAVIRLNGISSTTAAASVHTSASATLSPDASAARRLRNVTSSRPRISANTTGTVNCRVFISACVVAERAIPDPAIAGEAAMPRSRTSSRMRSS